MRKIVAALLLTATLALAWLCLYAAKAPNPATISLKDTTKHPFTVGLLVSKELSEYGTTKETHTWIPVGEYTASLFEKNLPVVFKSVSKVDARKPPQGIDLVVEPSIVKFDQVIPYPAYNPYRAKAVLHVDVYDREGNKLYAETVTGEFQTGKGMMSGFHARGLMTETASNALNDAVKQSLEGMQQSSEIKEYK